MCQFSDSNSHYAGADAFDWILRVRFGDHFASLKYRALHIEALVEIFLRDTRAGHLDLLMMLLN